MPKLTPKEIQKELSKNRIWPVYWLYGTEQMKVRELSKRIYRAVFQSSSSSTPNENPMPLAKAFDASQSDVTPSRIVDHSQNLNLDGTPPFLMIKDAQSLKSIDSLSTLLEGYSSLPLPKKQTTSICIFHSAKEADGRKKFFKEFGELTSALF